MKANLKKILLAFVVAGCALAGYLLWLTSRPVEIVAVHHRSSGFSAILVKNFPLTDKGKISWWLKNSKNIAKEYQIPTPAKDGSFYLTFWLFGDGYKEDKYDRLCFDDMKTKMNCIDKETVFTIKRFNYDREIFITYEGRYKLKDNGEIMKIHRE